MVKALCDRLNIAHSGQRFRDLAESEPVFQPRCPEVRFFFGAESLWRKRKPRAATDLTFGGGRATPADEEAALAAWREKQRLALTPQRAARLLERLVPEKSGRIGTDAFVLTDADELLDLLALAAYDHAPAFRGGTIRWAVTSPRRIEGLRPDALPRDPHAGWEVDRMEIERIPEKVRSPRRK
jgi:hypothetical protein